MSFSITASCIGCAACARACPVLAIAGERKGLHRIDPAKCIECGACGRVCPAEAVLDADGAPVRRLPRAQWPRPAFDLGRCIACGVCEAKCPARCIAMAPAALSESAAHAVAAADDWKPRLEKPEACVSCGWCAFYCPVSCIVVAAPGAAERAALPEEARA
ncbi:4Fe-4S binding protein [bacterium]|nr:4Fe-4S binding protein [bacterium]